MKNIIIAPSEVIAILKFKQEEANKRGLADPVGMFAQKQVGILNHYLDVVVSDVANSIGKSEDLVLLTAEKPSSKTIHIMNGPVKKQPVQLEIQTSQIADHALEAKIVTEASKSEVHVPSTAEVMKQVIENKLPETVNFMEEALKEQTIELYRSGNKIAAVKLVIKYYSDPRFSDGKIVTNFNQAMILINEWLGIDPLKDLKQKVALLYDDGNNYTAAYRFVEENLKKAIALTGDPKQDASLIHKFTWDVINNLSQHRREEIARRKAKKTE